MRVIALVWVCVCVWVADCDVTPLQLAQPIPSMAPGALDGVKLVTEYHASVGVPEAARIATAEERQADQGSHESQENEGRQENGGPTVMIIGGLASYRGEHPYMAGLIISLTTGETSVCGGSLVSSGRVLTAAACYWDGLNQAYAMQVVLGSVSLFSGGVRVSASSIVVHGLYSPASIHYNLALLTIPSQASTAYVSPIALATGSEQFEGYRAEVMGYGRTAETAPITTSATLRDLFVDVVSAATCSAYYGSVVGVGELCAGGVGGRAPCGGDQGGPLVLRNGGANDMLIGVYTFGSTSGCSVSVPSGYMRVTYFYSWIISNV